MKRTSLLILLSGLMFSTFLFSCKDDTFKPDSKEEAAKFESIEVIKTKPNAATNSLVEFSYDNQNRLIKTGFSEYVYDKNGKVEKVQVYTDKRELYSEHSYLYDQQGRLTEVKLTFLRNPNSTTDLAADKPVVASFTYPSGSKLPSTIITRDFKFSKEFDFGPKGFGAPQKKEFRYDGNNVTEVIITGTDNNPFDENDRAYYARLFFKKGNKKHFLKGLYDKLGFNPLDYSEVISENQPELQASFQSREPITDVQPNWEQASKFVVAEDQKSRPVEVSVSIYPKDVSIHGADYLLWSSMYKIKYKD